MDWSSNHFNKMTSSRSQDSAVGSYKNNDSQGSEFSQVMTQDIFSQNSIASQSEVYKPTSMFEKWKNKQAILKQEASVSVPCGLAWSNKKTPVSAGLKRWDSNRSINSIGRSMGSNPPEKYTDTDERKLLDKMMIAIRDGNNEVKSSLMYLMERLEKINEASSGQLSNTFAALVENIQAQEDRLKTLIRDQDGAKGSVSEMKVKLSEKDGRITSLEEQLCTVRAEQNEKLTTTVKSDLQEFQVEVQQKIMDLTILLEKNQELQLDIMNDFQRTSRTKSDNNEVLTKTVKDGFKISEKRVITDMSKALQRMESKQTSQQKAHHNEVMQVIENSVVNLVQTMTSQVNIENHINEQTNSLMKAYKTENEAMLKSLKQIIQAAVKHPPSQESRNTVLVKDVGVGSTVDTIKLMEAQHQRRHQYGIPFSFDKDSSCERQPAMSERAAIQKNMQYLRAKVKEDIPNHCVDYVLQQDENLPFKKQRTVKDAAAEDRTSISTQKMMAEPAPNSLAGSGAFTYGDKHRLIQCHSKAENVSELNVQNFNIDSKVNMNIPHGVTQRSNSRGIAMTSEQDYSKGVRSTSRNSSIQYENKTEERRLKFTSSLHYNCTNAYQGNGNQNVRQNVNPVRTAALVSPFQIPGCIYTPSRTGPSPCAVVLPQRPNENLNESIPKGTSLEPPSKPVSKKRKKKYVYSQKKKSKPKKCPIEGLTIEPSFPETEQETYQNALTNKHPTPKKRQLRRTPGHFNYNATAGNLKNWSCQYASKAAVGSVSQRGDDAYKFVGSDAEDLYTPRAGIKENLKNLKSTKNGKQRSGIQDSVAPWTVSSPQRSVGDCCSPSSSPAVSAMEVTLNRKFYRMPSRGLDRIRRMAGPAEFFNHGSSKISSPGKSLLSYI